MGLETGQITDRPTEAKRWAAHPPSSTASATYVCITNTKDDPYLLYKQINSSTVHNIDDL